MKTPRDILEVYLQPGEFYFGEERTRISTLLGSCVAITLWHPTLHVGGMCHFLLPEGPAVRPAGAELDGRYGEDAMRMFLREMRLRRTDPKEYRMKVFGGGAMGPRRPVPAGTRPTIPAQNVARTREMAERYGIPIDKEDMGGTQHRFVMLDLWTGDAWVRRGPRVSTG